MLLGFVMDTECVLCEAETHVPRIIYINVSLQRDNLTVMLNLEKPNEKGRCGHDSAVFYMSNQVSNDSCFTRPSDGD
jgi:hypothetical protein